MSYFLHIHIMGKLSIETVRGNYTVLQITFSSLFYIKESKITQVVCPWTEQHMNPLIPIGGDPANTMVSQGLSWDWWGRSQGRKWALKDVKASKVNQSYKFKIEEASYNIIVIERKWGIRFYRQQLYQWI